MELFKLLGTIAIDNAAANKALKETSSAAKETGETISGTSDSGDSAGGKLSGAFQKIGSGALALGKTVVKGVAVAAGGVSALATAAINSYADYEQLVGGVDTLFKDSSGKVQEYAKNAFRTAGLSANEYMETVTSFSASLLQSLDGDTSAAAEKANMAITDMSDNANKMGTDMSLIQNAYNGFAKANYTMLDNLKLGYGGTKEEMARLLADAQAISGIEYDISSYADVVDAIHVIQTEMGITGTTAKEASSTISGSITSMKSSWQNLLTAISSDDLPFDDYVNSFVESVSTVVGNLMPRISTALNGVVQLIDGLAPVIIGKLPELFNQLLPSVINAAVGLIDSLVAAFPGIVSALVNVLPALIEGVTQVVNSLVEALPSIIQVLVAALPTLLPALIDGIVSMVITLCTQFAQIIQPIIDYLPVIIISIVQALMNNLPALIDGVIALVMGIVAALPDIILGLVNAIPTIVTSIVEALLKAIPQLIEAAVQIVMALVAAMPEIIMGLVEALPSILQSVWDAIVGVFKGLPEWFGQLWDGIKRVSSQWCESAKEIFNSLKDKAVEKCTELKDKAVEKFSEFKEKASEKFSAAKEAISESLQAAKKSTEGSLSAMKSAFDKHGGGMKGAAAAAMEGIKSLFKGGFTFLNTLTNGKFGDIVNGIKSKMNAARDVVSGIIDKIKGFFNFTVKLPHIKLPHFSIKPSGWKLGDLLEGSIPSLGIEWYAKAMKNPMVMTKPTVFGYNAETGKLKAGGDAGSEVVSGTSTLMGMIQAAVASQNEALVYAIERIIEILASYFPQLIEALDLDIVLEDGVLVGRLAPKMNEELGKISARKDRGR